jgi:hypothetical protein
MSIAPNQDKRQDIRRLLLERLFAALSNPSKLKPSTSEDDDGENK